MKPKNFPGRKNARRLSAEARRRFAWCDAEYKPLRDLELAALAERIMPEAMARAVRTKKRGGWSSVRRPAAD